MKANSNNRLQLKNDGSTSKVEAHLSVIKGKPNSKSKLISKSRIIKKLINKPSNIPDCCLFNIIFYAQLMKEKGKGRK